jgi:hypothetical protein
MVEFYKIIIEIIFSPAQGWIKAKEAGFEWKILLFSLVLPAILISSLAKVYSINPESIFYRISPNVLLVNDVISTVIALLLGSYMIKMLAPRYLSVTNFNTIFCLVGISYVPYYLSFVIAAISPALALMSLVGLVIMVFVFWKGIDVMMETPPHRKTGFAILCMLILFGAAVVSGVFVSYFVLLFSGNMELLT